MCDEKVKERGRRLTPELICADGAEIICNGLSTLRKEEKTMRLLPKSVRQVHGTDISAQTPAGGRETWRK